MSFDTQEKTELSSGFCVNSYEIPERERLRQGVVNCCNEEDIQISSEIRDSVRFNTQGKSGTLVPFFFVSGHEEPERKESHQMFKYYYIEGIQISSGIQNLVQFNIQEKRNLVPLFHR